MNLDRKVAFTYDELHSDWDTGMFAPSCYVAVDHAHRWVVLAIRGTFHSSDALTDACADEIEFLDGYAHAGMCAAAWNMIKDQLPRLALTLHRHPGYELVTTGHSMGGGVASLFTMLLHSDDADVDRCEPGRQLGGIHYGHGRTRLLLESSC